MEMTLEQEFLLRVTGHKLSLLSAVLEKEYVEENLKGDVTIPEFIVKEQAPLVAKQEVAQIFLDGKLDEEYNKAWEKVKDVIPDNFGIFI